ncbi:hypothetical protein D3C86_2233630 [compost metagenome]
MALALVAFLIVQEAVLLDVLYCAKKTVPCLWLARQNDVACFRIFTYEDLFRVESVGGRQTHSLAAAIGK